MDDLIAEEKINIEDMIYEIRGKQVIMDRDIALLYKTETRIINQIVKRNIKRFPNDFYFQLTQEEFEFWKSQIVISNQDKKGLRKYPYAFTEQGVAMLSALLKTDIAIQTSIQIIDTFVKLRKYISNNLIEQKYINNQVMKNTEDIRLLQESFSKLEKKEITNEIYFNGQIYDAYSKIVDILNEAKEEVIIIDNYADKSVLDIISSLKVNVILITKKFSLLKYIDIKKYNKQYSNLVIKYNNTFHDRYFILDNKIVYHLGSSINHAGSKTFSINKVEDEFVIESLIRMVNECI